MIFSNRTFLFSSKRFPPKSHIFMRQSFQKMRDPEGTDLSMGPS